MAEIGKLFCKELTILGLAGHMVSIATTQLCCRSTKTAMGNKVAVFQ